MKKGEKRRDELIRIAYGKFLEKGYEQTSIDEIIEEARIAKGTFYYHFPSKEATLEAVIDMMIDEDVAKATEIVDSPMPVPEKIAAVIYSFRPGEDEQGIAMTVNEVENILLHDKLNKRLIEVSVPLLSRVVREGIDRGVFDCEQVEERVKMILITSSHLLDDGDHTKKEVIAFVDMVEKTLGAKPGTMGFIKDLVSGGRDDG